MSLLNLGGCDHEYPGQSGCVCSLSDRLRQSADLLLERGRKEQRNLMSLSFSIDVALEAADALDAYPNRTSSHENVKQ